MLARSTKCGGNSAALVACRDVVRSLRTISLDRGGKPLSVTNLSGPEREYFRSVPGLSWLPGSRVLIAAGPVTLEQDRPREVLVVCDTPFNNVPRRPFRRAPFAHAVGYSDGTVGLVSVQDFRRFDLSHFVDVKNIADTKIEPNGAANGSQPVRPTNQTSAAADSGRGP